MPLVFMGSFMQDLCVILYSIKSMGSFLYEVYMCFYVLGCS